MTHAPGKDRYMPPGTIVRLKSVENDGPEYGVVIHCWKNDEIGAYDCYVAFFGATLPTGKPTEKPYVLRYAASSLEERSYFDMAPEEVYGTFLSAICGLEDDAGIEGYSALGLEHLRAAVAAFVLEYKDRHGDKT